MELCAVLVARTNSVIAFWRSERDGSSFRDRNGNTKVEITRMPEPPMGGLTLSELGWRPHFAAHMGVDGGAIPVRVMAVHRDALEVRGPQFQGRTPHFMSDAVDERATVGDWIALDGVSHRPLKVLERLSLFKRKSKGEGRALQLICANVDTALIVTSANNDFSPARLERYLATAREAAVTPVVVLTKRDLVDDIAPYVQVAQCLMDGLIVEALDARDPAAVLRLSPWTEPGQTLVVLGSSGVGKSTLLNTLLGRGHQATQEVRSHDDSGRHTTTGRSMHRLPSGAWLIDTPGMRELQLADVTSAIAEIFDDIAALVLACRFSDCRHRAEPGCAVRDAMEKGAISADRLNRFLKLQRESARNTEALHEARARSRTFGKMAKRVFAAKQERRKDW
jgi:ribosome biogenesis GTPase